MFRLLRYFSITSLVAFVIVTIALAQFYRQTAVNDLVALGGEKNVALTQAFANSLWPQFVPFVKAAGDLDIETLQKHPEVARLNQVILMQIRGLSVVKIKVYDLNGLTVFSTEFGQIGQDQSQNAGFLSARQGQVATALVHRETFNAYDAVLENRDLIQSYIPVYSAESGDVEAVFELYSDVTPLLDRIERTQLTVAVVVVAILALLYATLFLIVRRADSIIRQQYADLQQAYADLSIARDQAEQANAFKTRLIANVSHDLRTPLGVISGYTEMLKSGMYGALSENQRRVVQKMMVNTQHLTDLVNDLIYQAQLEAGELKISLAPFSVIELLDSVRNTIGILAESKGLTLNVSVSPDLPAVIEGDALHLKQVLNNLVGNAIKFTQEGSITVEAERCGETCWAISVTDTGPGIPPEAREHIFEPFRKSVSPETSKDAGLGLGLSIVRQVVTLMGGQIAVKSQVGQGSCFTVTLPLKPFGEEKGV